MIDLRTALPRLLPKTVAWAEEQQADILASGGSRYRPSKKQAIGSDIHISIAKNETNKILIYEGLSLASQLF